MEIKIRLPCRDHTSFPSTSRGTELHCAGAGPGLHRQETQLFRFSRRPRSAPSAPCPDCAADHCPKAEVKGLDGVRGPFHSCFSSPLGAELLYRVLGSWDRSPPAGALCFGGCYSSGLLQHLLEGAAVSTERVSLPQLPSHSETFQNSYSGLIIPFWKWIKLKRKKALVLWNMSIRTGASAETVVLVNHQA